LKELNLPEYSFRIITQKGKQMIFDPLRRKYVRLTPEEWVRQNFINYLVHEGSYPPGLIGVEVPFDDEVFDQIATYNLQFKVPYLVVTNGMTHYACRFNSAENKFNDLLAIPLYNELIG
jgi:hypothetical protein